MILTGANQRTQRNPCSSLTLFTNPTWTALEANPDLCGEKPSTNRLYRWYGILRTSVTSTDPVPFAQSAVRHWRIHRFCSLLCPHFTGFCSLNPEPMTDTKHRDFGVGSESRSVPCIKKT
jgi:hypothetical protein